MKWIYSILIFLMHLNVYSQALDSSRSVDWTLAGLRDVSTIDFVEIDMQDHGAVANGNDANDAILANVLSIIPSSGAILNFQSGAYLFDNTISIPSNVIIKGQGAEETTFIMNLSGSNDAFRVQGSPVLSDTTSVVESAVMDSNFVVVSSVSNFSVGNWVQIIQEDGDMVTSSWARKSVGQIVKIKNIIDNHIEFESPLRMDYNISRLPYIVKIIPVENVGIECIKILRIDDTAPHQSSNIKFSYAVNSWVKGIESENCTFSHISALHSSNLYISKSYFHHAFSYGGGGRAYGVMLQSTSNECLVENNIFEHLRHSMIVQSGANGNVFAYNYSFDPYWTSFPNNAAGDMVLHGNYPYSNLFEQNICQNIIIDDSHGPNGPFNTFFRNRAESFGIFFSQNNSPNQNFLGNEIPNTGFMYSLVNYTILGSGHFVFGNNNLGNIDPIGTDLLDDQSYAYTQTPSFVPLDLRFEIGTPNIMGDGSIPAYERYNDADIFRNTCDDVLTSTDDINSLKKRVLLYPNPVQSELAVKSSNYILKVSVINSMGQEVFIQKNIGFSSVINVSSWENGVYLILIDYSNNKTSKEVIVKTS